MQKLYGNGNQGPALNHNPQTIRRGECRHQAAVCGGAFASSFFVGENVPLRVNILTQNLYYNFYCPKPKYLINGYLDPLGRGSLLQATVEPDMAHSNRTADFFRFHVSSVMGTFLSQRNHSSLRSVSLADEEL